MSVFSRFKSNYVGNGQGYQLEYAESALSEWSYSAGECGGTFTTLNGLLNSPSYPDEYPNRVECNYTIIQPTGMYIDLTVLMFDTYDKSCGDWILEGSDKYDYMGDNDVKYDYLEIRDGKSENSSIIGRFCGATIPLSMRSNTNVIWIRYDEINLSELALI